MGAINMSKNKPTAKNIRQGQTIYFLDHNEISMDPKPHIITRMLYSQKESLPTEGSIVIRFPVTLLRRVINQWGNLPYFFSYKKALTALKRLERRNETQLRRYR